MPSVPEYTDPMNYLQTYEVYELALQIHEQQRTKKGKRYFGHIWKVAEGAKTIWQKENGYCHGIDYDHLVQTAYLHDAIEDQVTEDYLILEGIRPEVIKSVNLLTKKDGQNYLEYIWAIKDDPIANIVKRADLEHNSKLSRLTVGDSLDKLMAKHVKYMKAYLFLSGAISDEMLT